MSTLWQDFLDGLWSLSAWLRAGANLPLVIGVGGLMLLYIIFKKR